MQAINYVVWVIAIALLAWLVYDAGGHLLWSRPHTGSTRRPHAADNGRGRTAAAGR